jgi:hypothetical protein
MPDSFLTAIDDRNAAYRTRELRSLSDVALIAYRDRIEAAILQTPDEDREIMALFDEHEMTATLAEMKRRRLHPDMPQPAQRRWRIVRLEVQRGEL